MREKRKWKVTLEFEEEWLFNADVEAAVLDHLDSRSFQNLKVKVERVYPLQTGEIRCQPE